MWAGFLILVLAFFIRIANFPSAFVNGVPQFLPFDDLYHAKRIVYSAAHPFRVLSFDSNRGTNGAFCPWPPLYDMLAGAVARGLGGNTPIAALTRAAWFPPIVASLVAAAIAAWMTRRFSFATGLLAGVGVALSIYYLDKSRLAAIDHHFLEFPLALGILAATVLAGGSDEKSVFRRGVMLAAALVFSLLVQPALLVAAAASLLGILALERSRLMARAAGGVGFALASAALLVYRGLQPPGYPENQWYLGTPHAAALLGAAAACAGELWALEEGFVVWRSAVIALPIGILTIIAIPNAASAILGGSEFFAGDAWFRSISEFQPLFTGSESVWLLDLCLLGGGALLVIVMVLDPRWRRGLRLPVTVFAVCFLLAALSSMRFLSVAAPLLAVCGALVFCDVWQSGRRRLAIAAAALLVLPSTLSLGRAVRPTPTIKPEGLPVVRAVTALAQSTAPPGRVLARGTWGHLINVVANRPALLDNFGLMDSRTRFENAAGILLVSREKAIADFCYWHGIRFVLLENPRPYSATDAELGGLPRSAFERRVGTNFVPTRRMKATFWWRAYFEGGEKRPDLGSAGEAFRSFRLVAVEKDTSPEAATWAVQIWEFVGQPGSARRTN